MSKNEGVPNNEQVRLIYKDTYNFYTKWIAVKEPSWEAVMADVHVIENKYPLDLCRKILVEIIEIIEQNSMAKEEDYG